MQPSFPFFSYYFKNGKLKHFSLFYLFIFDWLNLYVSLYSALFCVNVNTVMYIKLFKNKSKYKIKREFLTKWMLIYIQINNDF